MLSTILAVGTIIVVGERALDIFGFKSPIPDKNLSHLESAVESNSIACALNDAKLRALVNETKSVHNMDNAQLDAVAAKVLQEMNK